MASLFVAILYFIAFCNGEVRDNVNIFGVTTSTTFSRPSSQSMYSIFLYVNLSLKIIIVIIESVRCPYNFPFAFKSGTRCCRHQWKRSNFSDAFDDCDGFQIGLYSDCCSDADSIECTDPVTQESKRCRNYITEKAVTPEMSIINKESVYLIDLTNECTARLADFPEEGRHHKAATIFQDKLLVCGGRNSANEDQSNCYLANEYISEWTEMGVSYPTRGASLITIDPRTDQERLMMAGGVLTPEIYDVPMGYGNGSPWQFLDPKFRLPTDKLIADFCLIQIAEEKFFLTGHKYAYNASDPNGWINEANVYEEGQGWRRVADVPWGGAGRDSGGAVSCALTSKGEVMLLGGKTKQVFLFNAQTETWKRITDMERDCNGPGMLNVNGRMHLFGSCGVINGDLQGNEVFVLEPAGYWRQLENLQMPYNAHHTTVLPVREEFFTDITC